MTDDDVSHTVITETINPFGMCLGEELPPAEDYDPYATAQIISAGAYFDFRSYLGNLNEHGQTRADHRFVVRVREILQAYVRRTYNIPDDVNLNQGSNSGAGIYSSGWCSGSSLKEWDFLDYRRFGSEEQALSYVDTLGDPEPIYTIPMIDNDDSHIPLFWARWREEVDGVFIERRVELKYTGDEVTLYTINDVINFLALFFEVTPEEVLNEAYYNAEASGNTTLPLDDGPTLDCETYKRTTVTQDYFPAGPIEVDIDFDGFSIPADVAVTITHVGNPVVPTTLLENGDGSLVISDDGNINMRNDGGTFFLNEFGNVGFYAAGDASLTAESQVQLGSGGTTFNVDSNGLNMRDSTGTVSFTADELSRLKDLLS